MANNNNRPEITLHVNPNSFSKYESIKPDIDIIRADLERHMKANPLQIDVGLSIAADALKAIDTLQQKIVQLKEHQDIVVNIDTTSALNSIEALKTQIAELKGTSFAVSVDADQAIATVSNLSNEVNAQLAKIGDITALKGLNKAFEDFGKIPSKFITGIRQASGVTTQETKGMSSAIGSLTKKVNGLGDSILKFRSKKLSDEDSTYDEILEGANNLVGFVTNLSKKLQSTPLELTARLNVPRTVKAIKEQINGSASLIPKDLERAGATIPLVGSIDVTKTVANIKKTMKSLTDAVENATKTSVDSRAQQETTTATAVTTKKQQTVSTPTSSQMAAAVNRQVDAIKPEQIHKIPIQVEIQNISQAVNEAIVQAHNPDSPLASMLIPISVGNITSDINAAIEQINSAPGTIKPINVDFYVGSDSVTNLIAEAQKVSDALQTTVDGGNGVQRQSKAIAEYEKKVSAFNKAVTQATKTKKKFDNEALKTQTFKDGDKDVAYFDELKNKISAAETKLKEFQNLALHGSAADALKFYDDNNLEQMMEQLRALRLLAEDFYKTLGGSTSSGAQADAKFEAKIAKWEQQLSQWSNVIFGSSGQSTGINEFEFVAATAHMKELIEARQKLANLQNQPIVSDADKNQITELQNKIEGLTLQIDQFIARTKQSRSAKVGEGKEYDKITKLQQKLNDYVAKYEARLKRFPKLWEQVRDLQAKVNAGGDSVALQREMNTLLMQARSVGVETENIFTKIWERVGFNFRSMVASYGIMLVRSTLRGIYENVKELDTAMTELKKVTDGTAATYTDFLEGATERAQKLGASLTDVVNATSSYARLGYSIEEASELGDIATMYKQVGDDVESIDDATESLISTMNGFGLAADDAMHIIDVFNEIGNRFPTSSGQIGEGLKRSAAAMSAAGNTLEETVALFTAAQATIQNAESVGTILKTTSMRIRGKILVPTIEKSIDHCALKIVA